VAINALKQFEWNLEVACDNYFANPDAFAVKTQSAPGKKAGPVDPAKIDSLFETYRGTPSFFFAFLLLLFFFFFTSSGSALTRAQTPIPMSWAARAAWSGSSPTSASIPRT
jgi:hypothetical protein